MVNSFQDQVRISNFPFGKQEYPRPVETWAYVNPITGRKKKSKKRRKKIIGQRKEQNA